MAGETNRDVSNNEGRTDSVAEILAALVNGDRWLCAAAGAAYLGQMPKKTFLTFACQPGFPAALAIGKRRMWRKSELDDWAERRRAAQSRQKAA